MSKKNAVCLDEVMPRTPQCLAFDEVHRSAVRSLTTSITLDSKFGPAYALRAIALGAALLRLRLEHDLSIG